MPKFFKRNSISVESSSSEKEYDFKPITGTPLDEETDSLFEQLEEGATIYTDLCATIRAGANVYAKKTEGRFEGCYPIHIAAYLAGSNTAAVNSILEAFDDPEERKKYIYSKSNDRNVLEILLQEHAGMEEDIAIDSILSIFSYLTVDEQQELIASLSPEAKAILEEDESYGSNIYDFATLNYHLKHEKPVEMCRKRREEAQVAFANYDSDEESFGQLKTVKNKKFTAKVSYQDIIGREGVISSVPELILIPSDWRLETALHPDQGDHVTAYVLLLSSFSHCKGENVKLLPEIIFNFAISVLPDYEPEFLMEKRKTEQVLNEKRQLRIKVVSSLKAFSKMNEVEIYAVENNLKKVEIEEIARYMESAIDRFIMILNKLKDESFSHKRKESLTKQYALQGFINRLEKHSVLAPENYSSFKNYLLQAIREESGKSPDSFGVTEKTLKAISGAVAKKSFKHKPKEVLSRAGNLTAQSLLDFLKENTPFKKYHEGYVINEIRTQISELKTIRRANRNNHLCNIGFSCFKLFDYPKVNDDRLNNVEVLYQAIPRHWIIINAAFSELKSLSSHEKERIFDSLLQNILELQQWENYRVLGKNNRKVPLNLELLKEKISDYANIDGQFNFSMKPSSNLLEEEESEDHRPRFI